MLDFMHEHYWQIQSEHSTSSGTVTYFGCHCGAPTMRLKAETETLLAAVVSSKIP